METKIFEDFEVIEGKKKIIISAPHGYIHMRANEIRLAEKNTDTLAIELAEEKKVYAIYKNISSDNDADFDTDSVYKKECLKQIKKNKIKLLVDIHGIEKESPYDIVIDSQYFEDYFDKDIINNIRQIFIKYGFENVSNNLNRNEKLNEEKNSIIRYVYNNANIATLKIYINGKYRLEECEEYHYDTLKNVMSELIDYLIKITK